MLQEASFELTDLAMANPRQAEEDKRLLVVFSRRPWQNKLKSAEEGRPIYEERDYVTIMVPGDKDSVIDRLATDIDKARFSAQYTAFLQKQSQELAVGTPLRAVSFISQSQIKELEFFNCFTVEQLANLADSNAQKFMGINALKQLAQDFLKAAKEQAPLTAMRAELDKKDEQLAAQAKAIEDQAARIKALEVALTKKA